MRMEISDCTLLYNNTSFVYGRSGNLSSDDVIVMLHPAFADRDMFERQLQHFGQQYRILLPDMPGHGRNRNCGSITMRDMPELLHAILEQEGIKACHLIGVSMGSLAAQAFADRYPNRVLSVIIVGGYSIHKANSKVLKAQRKEMGKWMLYILFSMRKFKQYLLDVSCYTDECRELLGRGVAVIDRGSFRSMSGMNGWFRHAAEPMRYPLLIAVGEHDLPLLQDSSLELHALEPNSRFVVLSDAGHCANADVPEVFNEVADHFLKECRYGSPNNGTNGAFAGSASPIYAERQDVFV